MLGGDRYGAFPTFGSHKEGRGEPVALTLTALAPQLFRDLFVRSFCVSRFTVNKKAQEAPQLFRDLVVRSPCVSRFTETWLFAPPVSRFTVNKKAQEGQVSRFTVNKKAHRRTHLWVRGSPGT